MNRAPAFRKKREMTVFAIARLEQQHTIHHENFFLASRQRIFVRIAMRLCLADEPSRAVQKCGQRSHAAPLKGQSVSAKPHENCASSPWV